MIKMLTISFRCQNFKLGKCGKVIVISSLLKTNL